MSNTQDLLNGLNDLTGQQVNEDTRNCVRRKKVTVTEARHTDANGRNVISVQEPFGESFEVPFAPALVNVQPGETVWIEWVYGFTNACAVNGGAWQASDLPNCVVPTEDGLEMQVNYSPVMSIDANGMVVNGIITGNVVNTEEKREVTATGTIQAVLNNLGKYLKNDVSVIIQGGTYVENVEVFGFHGPGSLTIILEDGVYVNGDWSIVGNGNVRIIGNMVGNGSKPSITGVANEAAMEVKNTAYFECVGVDIHGCERSQDFRQDYGVLVSEGSRAYLNEMTIDRFDDAICVQNAHADIVDCIGGTASTDYRSVANLDKGVAISPRGGSVNAKGSIPMGPVSGETNYRSNGYPFHIYSASGGDTGDIPSRGSDETTPDTPVYATATWNADKAYTTYSQEKTYSSYCAGWQGDGYYQPTMGKYADGSYAAGIWTLQNASTIQSTLSGKTITKATVTITRLPSSGATTGEKDIKLYYHNIKDISNYRSKCDPFRKSSASTDKYVDCGCEAQYIARGENGTFELPSAMYALLQNGTVQGFGIGMNHPTRVYQFETRGCVLTVTYQD